VEPLQPDPSAAESLLDSFRFILKVAPVLLVLANVAVWTPRVFHMIQAHADRKFYPQQQTWLKSHVTPDLLANERKCLLPINAELRFQEIYVKDRILQASVSVKDNTPDISSSSAVVCQDVWVLVPIDEAFREAFPHANYDSLVSLDR
jgi:hypothetical protein